MWTIIETVTEVGLPPNEDVLGCEGSLAWVIDGATSTSSERCTNRESDGLWLVEVVEEVFREEGRTNSSPTEVIRAAIEEARVRAEAEWALTPTVPPSAAVGVVRAIGEVLHYAVLADVSLIHRATGETEELTDERPDDLNVEAKSQLMSLLGRGEDFASAISSTRALLLEHRRLRMNVAGGYWVLALEAEAAKHALTGRVDSRHPIILASDGFTRGRRLFGLWTDWHAAFDGSTSLLEMASSVRASEAADSQCVRYPRWSVHDDLVAARLRWSSENNYR